MEYVVVAAAVVVQLVVDKAVDLLADLADLAVAVVEPAETVAYSAD